MELRAIAQITKVFGIKGEVKIYSYARSADEYREIENIFVGREPTKVEQRTIEKIQTRGNDIYIKFFGVDDRNTAETLQHTYIFVEEQQRKKLPQGSFYLDEVIGLHVVDEEGKELGKVREVTKNSTYSFYIVETPKGDVYVPAVSEIIKKINLAQKKIIVSPPEGMFSGEMA